MAAARAVDNLAVLRPVVLSLLALAAACVSTRESAPAGLDGARVTRAFAVEAWSVIDGEVAVGSLVRYEPKGEPLRGFFAVRNEHGQDLGLVDSLGRAYRHRPHLEEPEWVGTGTVEGGVARILARPRVTLERVRLGQLAQRPEPRVLEGPAAPFSASDPRP